jgi:hypothetical protein
LTDLGHIKQIEVINTKMLKGSVYEIYAGLEDITVQNVDRSKIGTGLQNRPITDHDDEDPNTTDLHQDETMKIYQSLTSNSWTKADRLAYEKIKSIPLDRIAATIRAVVDRAKDRPRSLNYFVSEILSGSQGREVRTKAERRALEKTILRLRDLHVGGDFESFKAHVEKECLRKGVTFDLDLFNEILGGVR